MPHENPRRIRTRTDRMAQAANVHHLAATPQTLRFGVFDAAIPPVLTVDSGDVVTME